MSRRRRAGSIAPRGGRRVALGLASLLAVACTAWAMGAFWFDLLPGRITGIAGYGLLLTVTAFGVHGVWRKVSAILLCFACVLAWWLTLKPSNDRPWQPDVDRTAWAEIDKDEVRLHNVRNCNYRSETDFTPRWETRTVRLSQLTAIDLALNYWGSPYMAHPIVSFQFSDSPPVCFSIETRKETGESYSAIGGLYRQFELIYVVADERDVIRVRSNFRKGEDVYLYRTSVPPAAAPERFLEYVAALNRLHTDPRWYNAVTTNCTTSIRTQRAAALRSAWDWRLLVNGKGDELLFDRGVLVADGLAFTELKKQARINSVAKAADTSPDFSRRIREGRAGF